MRKIDEVLKCSQRLLKDGTKLLTEQRKDRSSANLPIAYEAWYTEALAAIQQLAPERTQDFVAAYKLERRKSIEYDTYTISDYLIGLAISQSGRLLFDIHDAFRAKFLGQLAILRAAVSLAPSVLRDIHTLLRAELLDDDLLAARELLKARHVRSAGVVCGVAIEAHLKSLCARHSIKFRKKRLTISDLNDALKKASVYDVPTWRLIQRLADIRNLCGHSADRDPKREEVEDLITGTEKIVKEVY